MAKGVADATRIMADGCSIAISGGSLKEVAEDAKSVSGVPKW